MSDAGSGWEFLWPATLWEHRAKLRRKHPFLFYTSILLLLTLAGLFALDACQGFTHP